MTTTTTTYYLTLRRRGLQPSRGWIINAYWLGIARGEPDMHLVEVDETRALLTQQAFDALRHDD